MIPTQWVSFLGLGFLTAGAAAQQHYAITGVPTQPNSAVPLRLNINDLQAKGGPQWDLYLRALTVMMNKASSDWTSYFQIAGIHGKPYIEWNGGGSKNTDGWQGYCPHGEKLFVSWHRPFVMLFEQNLVSIAKQIAAGYPSKYRQQYQQAAETLRAPFWDWAAQSYSPPATVPSTMQISVPNGNELKKVNIANPLAGFNFPQDALNGRYGDFDSQRRKRTYRCTAPDSYPKSSNADLAARPYKSWVYDAFTHATNFSSFASTGDGGISLEQIHNGIHWDAGCAGQFLDADFSAFDPIFMMHHANVDRLWAYWQAINPDETTFTDIYSGGSRYSTPQGTAISAGSPLKPFYGADNKYHTSKTINSIQGLGYSYQALEYWQKSPDQMTADAKTLINNLYGDGTQSTKRGNEERDASTTRYFVHLELNVEDVERPCSLNIFVGGHSAGRFVVMKQPATGRFYGAFSLDQALEANGARHGSVDSTISSIHDSLGIEIAKPDGTRIALDTVSSLKVDIEDVRVVHPQSDDQLPKFSDSRRHSASLLNLDINLGDLL